MQVGPYTVVEELGAGGMGRVRLARDVAGRLVVLKNAIHDSADDDERLRDEARVGLRLRHNNIVETIDCFTHEGRPILVTGYVGGATLLQLRAQGPLSPVAVCAIGRQLASALDAIHTCTDDAGRVLGVLHRDVTGGNAIVDDAGCVRLIDLGIARSFESRAMRTQTGMLRGTLRYLAPELFDGGQQSAQSDLWALGVVLWEALVGRPAVLGSEVIAMARVCSGNVMALEPGEAPDPMVHKAIARLLRKHPADRPRRARDAAALFAMMERQLKGDAAVDLGAAVRRALHARGAVKNTRASVGLCDDTPSAQPTTTPWPAASTSTSSSTLSSSMAPSMAPSMLEAETTLTPSRPGPEQATAFDTPVTPAKSLLDFAAQLTHMERSLNAMWGQSETHTQEAVRQMPVVKGEALDSAPAPRRRMIADACEETDVLAVGGDLDDFFGVVDDRGPVVDDGSTAAYAPPMAPRPGEQEVSFDAAARSRIPTPLIKHQAPPPGSVSGLGGFPSAMPLPPHTPVHMPSAFERGALDAVEADHPHLLATNDDVTAPTGALRVLNDDAEVVPAPRRRAATIALVTVLFLLCVAVLAVPVLLKLGVIEVADLAVLGALVGLSR
jgi:serine/threonine-protein kinase